MSENFKAIAAVAWELLKVLFKLGLIIIAVYGLFVYVRWALT
jgi:hypothetical protein